MMDNQFVINKRFRVNEAVNTVTDLETGTETRLEPRLMKLIMLLTAHKGQVVTRQQIITDIWDDYGNADEGLSQAISFLRKIFADTDKQMIRTIPKKGYILEATVSSATQPPIPGSTSQKPRKLYLVPVITLIAAAIICACFFIFRSAPGTPAEPPGTEIDTTYQYQEMKDPANQIENKDIEAEKKQE